MHPTNHSAGPDHHRFFETLGAHSGLALERYRSAALTRRVPACLRYLRLKTMAEAREAVAARPELAPALIDVVLLGVTEFFRDVQVFDHLATVVLPALFAARPRPRIWSAACSNGQELYSLAMLLEAAGTLDRAELTGTDCRARAIADAEAGCFAPESLQRLPAGWRERFFVTESGRLRIDRRLRAATSWCVSDLLVAAAPGPWDLVLWRNMAIYLEPAAAEGVWRRIVAELAPGGYLVAGKADHPAADVPLRRVAPCVYQKVGTR